MAKKARELVKIECPKCGGGVRNHTVLREYKTRWDDQDAGEYGHDEYQICRCVGCETVRFRWVSWWSGDFGPRGTVPTVRVFPERVTRRWAQVESGDLPEIVQRIYAETVKALNAGATILAGGGLRAIVEAICKEQNVSGKTLMEKVDALESKGFLTRPQAELLHEERYIGNAALHEITPPAAPDLEDGLDIVEGLLNTLYVLPEKAERLRKARQAKGKARTKKTKKKGAAKKQKGET